ncbi:MAG: hypothetical protein AAFR61_02450 [Bacteroidota bacterium]
MKTIIPLCLVALFYLPTSLYAQSRLSLSEALAKNWVQVQARSLGGYQGQVLQVLVKNLSRQVLNLEIEAGHQFKSQDQSEQDLIVTAPAFLAIGPGRQKATSLYTMCTQAKNMAPKKGSIFSLSTLATGPLLELVSRIAEKDYQNSTAQSALWSITNKLRVQEIYAEDTSMVRDLAEIVSVARDIPLSSFDFRSRPHHITAIKTSLETLLPDHISRASLKLYDQEGAILRTYFTNQKLEKGFRQWKIGANHTLGDTAVLVLKLEGDGRLLAEKEVRLGDSVLSLPTLHAETTLNYKIAEESEISAGVYDLAGNLFFVLDEHKSVRPGLHHGRFIAQTPVLPGRQYEMRVMQADEILARGPLSLETTAARLFPRQTVSGAVNVVLEEEIRGGTLAVYEADGQLKRVFHNLHRVNAGRKVFRYFFTHRKGPDAIFYIRLTDGDGRIVHEQCEGCPARK